jgi:hypothetical protein
MAPIETAWQERTFGGALPETSRVQKIDVDTQNDLEHGERTWTTGQTVRDVLQNHLDACTQSYVDTLIENVLDIDALDAGKATYAYSDHNLNNFAYNLWLYRKGLEDLSPEGKVEMLNKLNGFSFGLPIRTDLLDIEGNIALEKLDQTITPVEEIPPQLTYNIKNVATGDVVRNVTLQELQSEQFAAKDDSGNFIWTINRIAIQDSGSGFDSKLTSLYKSTKAGKDHLRGKFGEGSKMSEIHLIRHNATIKMRSAYVVEGDSINLRRMRVWQHRAHAQAETDQDNSDRTIRQKGIEIDIPFDSKKATGSIVTIDIENADEEFKSDFNKNVDPRLPTGIGANCLEYSKIKYYYPMSSITSYTRPVGVSIEGNPDYQYVQGLKIGDSKLSTSFGSHPLFSYDFKDSNLLNGRDRNQLTDQMAGAIGDFWRNSENPELLDELVRRVFFTQHGATPEGDSLIGMLESNLEDLHSSKLRTVQTLLTNIPSTLGLHEGKNLLIATYELAKSENTQIIESLKAQGYKIIEIQGYISPLGRQRISEFHNGRFEIYDLEAVRERKESLNKNIHESDPRVERLAVVCEEAQIELNTLLDIAGIEPLDLEIDYLESLDNRTEKPVELYWDKDKSKFVLRIRPDMLLEGLKDGVGLEYWKNYIQIEMLGSSERAEPFPDKDSQYIYTQHLIDQVQQRTLTSQSEDMKRLPQDGFEHLEEVTAVEMLVGEFIDRLQNIEAQMAGWDLYNASREFLISFEGITELISKLDNVPTNYREQIEGILLRRVSLIGNEVGWCEKVFSDKSRNKYNIVLHRKLINELESAGKLEDGRDVYVAGSQLIVPTEFPQDAVIKYLDNQLVFQGDNLLNFGKYKFERYKFDTYPLRVNNGCISYASSGSLDQDIPNLQTAIESISISRVEKPKSREIKFLKEGKTFIETPLPIEYGKDEWDNPVRVFQDIIQNHMDASPNSKVTQRFEVMRQGVRSWIDIGELRDDDELVGYQVADNGDGYSPNDLGIIGRSSKKSPFFAGKYGEGQKMISAAAVRNGLNLSFTSVGTHGDRNYRWVANVGTRQESVMVNGTPTNVARVVFDMEAKDVDLERSRLTSFTTLRLPDDSDEEAKKKWEEWKKIVDPRQKDERHNGGLSRYVINLRESNSNIIDLGYMRILLDEPGAVYENGLLISTKSDSSAVGYDVPEIVTTRERNSYDWSKFRRYVSHAVLECQDQRYPNALLEYFQRKYVLPNTLNASTYIQESDLQFPNIANEGIVQSRPIWVQAFKSIVGEKLIFSQPAIEAQLKDFLRYREQNPNNGPAYIEEIERFRRALANVRHLPSDRVLDIPEKAYKDFAALFPTVDQFAQSIIQQEVDANEVTLLKLADVIQGNIIVAREAIQQLRETHEGRLLINCILESCTPNKIYSNLETGNSYSDNRLDKNIQEWITRTSGDNRASSVFVAPSTAGYMGLASNGKIGINENLLASDSDRSSLVETGRHEVAHHLFNQRDYTIEFMMALLITAKFNVSQ